MGDALGGLRTPLVGVIEHQHSCVQAMATQDHPGAHWQEQVPGDLRMAKHPRECRDTVGPQASPLELRPANRITNQHGHDAEREPGPLGRREPGLRLVLLYGFVDLIDKGFDKRQRGAEEHGGPCLADGFSAGIYPTFKSAGPAKKVNREGGHVQRLCVDFTKLGSGSGPAGRTRKDEAEATSRVVSVDSATNSEAACQAKKT